jgi:hypothetical protein
MSETSATTWLASRLAAADGRRDPYPHWLLSEVLPQAVARALPQVAIDAPVIGATLGKRETHNSERLFMSQEMQDRHAAFREVANLFQAKETVSCLEDLTGATLEGTSLRIEYCQDNDGFWLEPHTDIGAKKFTMLVYLSDDATAVTWGTDIYDGPQRYFGRVPGGFNQGLIFVPAENTWHGVEKRPFTGLRKSIIVNYVVPEWRSRHELAFPLHPVGR